VKPEPSDATGTRPGNLHEGPDTRLAAEVFERFPYGIVVTDPAGSVVGANRAARALLGPALTAGPVRCCDLVGCRRPGGPLADACLTELAAGNRGRLPEIRVDLAPESTAAASWVTAAPLDAEAGDLVVLELRPASPRDRRRRTEPHWMAGAQIRVRTLGRTEVESDETTIGGAWLEQRPGQLLKYLIAERDRVVPADEIAEAIWPNADPRTLGNLRHYVHALRDKLEPGRGRRQRSSFIVARHGGYTIDRGNIELDVDEFEAHVRAGLRHFQEGDLPASAYRLEEAKTLYRGDFLADEPFADWAFSERERVRELASRTLRTLAEIDLRQGHLAAAADHLERLAELQPLDTQVHRELIALCLRRGRRSEAMRRYSALRNRLRRHFDEDPEFALADLREYAEYPEARARPA
jgi:DNA-binding SARP family transcriptional activator